MPRPHEVTVAKRGDQWTASCSRRDLTISSPDETLVRKQAGYHAVNPTGPWPPPEAPGPPNSDILDSPPYRRDDVYPPRDVSGMVRQPDYDTSIEGARAAVKRAGNQRLLLLEQYRRAAQLWTGVPGKEGLTDEEAGEAAGLLGSNYWKRAGELRASEWTMWHPDDLKRKGHAGVNRKVSILTDEGRAALARREGEEVEE